MEVTEGDLQTFAKETFWEPNLTRSQAVARIADHTALQQTIK